MKLLPTLSALLVIGALTGQAIAAENCNQVTRETNGELIAADALLARPAGIVATAVGSVLYVIALPFTAVAGGEDAVRERLIGGPARYAFNRCLGDFRYRRYGPNNPGE